MKNKIKFIVFVCLSNFCLSQQKIENTIYETNDFYIKYNPEEFNLKVNSEKCERLFCNMFEITNKKNNVKPLIPIVQLKVSDYSMFGIGTHLVEKELKDKDSNYLKITTLDNFVHYEKKTKIDNFILVSYVCIRNNKVYTLECLTEMIGENENNENELKIMNTFRVK
jgi:hypothetical protein